MENDGVVSEIPGNDMEIRITSRNMRDIRDEEGIQSASNSGIIGAIEGHFEKETIVMDTKRKRVELEENKEKNMEDNNSDTMNKVDGPKNELEAGLGFQARLEQYVY